jgi:hypothetical protein
MPSGWNDKVGVMSAGGRVVGVTSVHDVMPGSKGGLIQVIQVERQNSG